MDGEGIMSLAWETDIEAGLERARAQQRPILFDFTAAPS